MPQGATLYAVLKQTPITASDTQRPQGSYGIVISFPTAANGLQAGYLVSESAGRIVAIESNCGRGAKALVTNLSNPDFLLAPPK